MLNAHEQFQAISLQKGEAVESISKGEIRIT